VSVIVHGLGKQPFMLLFLVVGAGYALGRVKVKGIGLGATAASLLVGLAISMWAASRHGTKFAVPEFASTVFFNLFMFSIGMKVGPQFIAGLRRDAGKFIFFGTFIPVLSLGLMFGIRAMFDMPPGLGAGIFAGANTATPGLGAAQAALASASHGDKAVALANLTTAFAFSYCISMVLFVLSMKLPDVLGADTPAAARAFEAEVRGAGKAPLPGEADEFFGGPLPVARRTYLLEAKEAIGKRLDELRRTYPFVSVERIVRNSQLLEPADDLVLQAHDTVALYGRVSRLINAASRIGPEVDAPEARDVGAQTVDIVVHDDRVAGKTLSELAAGNGHGLFLNAMFHAGEQVPVGPDTVVSKGDILRVTGSDARIAGLAQRAGRLVRASLSTDIVTLAAGLTMGALVGLIAIPIGGGVKLTLGSAVGLLLTGIALSTLRTRHPAFGGPYPEPARQLIEDLGLNIFIAILGINAGAGMLAAISGGAVAPILVGSLVLGLIPGVAAWIIGRNRPFRMNAALLMGAIAGGRCNSAGMRAAQEATGSTVPAVSYPVTFAISNVLFTLFCYVIAVLG
jgi:putative transport protein